MSAMGIEAVSASILIFDWIARDANTFNLHLAYVARLHKPRRLSCPAHTSGSIGSNMPVGDTMPCYTDPIRFWRAL